MNRADPMEIITGNFDLPLSVVTAGDTLNVLSGDGLFFTDAPLKLHDVGLFYFDMFSNPYETNYIDVANRQYTWKRPLDLV